MNYNRIEDLIISRELKIEDLTQELDLLYDIDIEENNNEVRIVKLELIVSEVQRELDNLYTLKELIEETRYYD